jgi:hypothetical protein
MLRAATLGWLLTLTAWAADVGNAIVEQPGAQVRMPLGNDEFGWSAAAEKVLGREAFQPNPRRVDELWLRRHEILMATEVRFPALVPNSLRAEHYYLLSTAGISALELRSLEGALRYNFRSATILNRVEASGDALLTPIETPRQTAGGFVFRSVKPLNISITILDKTSVRASVSAGPQLTYRQGNTSLSASFRRFSYDMIPRYASRVLILSENVEYLFVEWEPSYVDCESMFTLFSLTPTSIEEVNTNAYHCDI